jgi:hypothetical protein
MQPNAQMSVGNPATSSLRTCRLTVNNLTGRVCVSPKPHLRRYIFCRTHKRKRSLVSVVITAISDLVIILPLVPNNFSSSKVSDFKVGIACYQYVLMDNMNYYMSCLFSAVESRTSGLRSRCTTPLECKCSITNTSSAQ